MIILLLDLYHELPRLESKMLHLDIQYDENMPDDAILHPERQFFYYL